MKFKTLKDIKYIPIDCTLWHVEYDELKQLAIKWVKEELEIHGVYTKQLLRWRERFNITEEDLT